MVDKMYFQVIDHFLPVQENICLNCLYAFIAPSDLVDAMF